jgi:hypothetical protein
VDVVNGGVESLANGLFGYTKQIMTIKFTVHQRRWQKFLQCSPYEISTSLRSSRDMVERGQLGCCIRYDGQIMVGYSGCQKLRDGSYCCDCQRQTPRGN